VIRAWRSNAIPAFFAGVLYALVAFSSFYIGWMFGIGLLVFSPDSLRWMKNERKRIARIAVAAVLGFLIGVVPLLCTYLPMVRDQRERTWDDACCSRSEAASRRCGSALS
jgi:hypothetical protein